MMVRGYGLCAAKLVDIGANAHWFIQVGGDVVVGVWFCSSGMQLGLA